MFLLTGSFGFVKGTFVEGGAGSGLAISSGSPSSLMEIPVLIKRANSNAVMTSFHPSNVNQHNDSLRRTFVNEVAIAAQLSYDCNVLKLCGMIRKGTSPNSET